MIGRPAVAMLERDAFRKSLGHLLMNLVLMPGRAWRPRSLIRILLASTSLVLMVPLAQAQVYRWVDEQGVVHFGDRAPNQAGVERLTPEPPKAKPQANARHAYDPELLRENERRYLRTLEAERRARQRRHQEEQMREREKP